MKRGRSHSYKPAGNKIMIFIISVLGGCETKWFDKHWVTIKRLKH